MARVEVSNDGFDIVLSATLGIPENNWIVRQLSLAGQFGFPPAYGIDTGRKSATIRVAVQVAAKTRARLPPRVPMTRRLIIEATFPAPLSARAYGCSRDDTR